MNTYVTETLALNGIQFLTSGEEGSPPDSMRQLVLEQTDENELLIKVYDLNDNDEKEIGYVPISAFHALAERAKELWPVPPPEAPA